MTFTISATEPEVDMSANTLTERASLSSARITWADPPTSAI